MIALNFNRFIAITGLLFLAACAQPPGSGSDGSNAPISAVDAKGKAGITTFSPRSQQMDLEYLSLWLAKEEPTEATPFNVWQGAERRTVVDIMPILVNSTNGTVKRILRRVAMSGAMPPTGMSESEYIVWRADVLAAQREYGLAARLLNSARLRRNSQENMMRRLTYQLADGQGESACLEALAAGKTEGDFWQGMHVLCSRLIGDAAAGEETLKAMADGPIKKAAQQSSAPAPLIRALVKQGGEMPPVKIILENDDMLDDLDDFLVQINRYKETEAEQKSNYINRNRGEMLLLALGALSTEEREKNTDQTTRAALDKLGL